MLSPRGGIMCDLTITRLGEDRFWVVTGGAVGRHDIAWMRRHLPERRLGRPHRPDLVAVLPGRLGPAGARPRRRAQRRRPLQRGAALHARRDAAHRPRPVPRAARVLRRRAGLGDLRAGRVRARAVGHAVGGRSAAGRGGVRRRRLRLAAPGEGLPAVGPGHRRGAQPLRGRPGLGRAAGQGRGLHRPRGRGRDQGARRRRGGCAAWSPTTPRSCSSARSRCSTASARSATSRAPASARRWGRASPTATCRSRWPSPARRSPCTAPAPTIA